MSRLTHLAQAYLSRRYRVQLVGNDASQKAQHSPWTFKLQDSTAHFRYDQPQTFGTINGTSSITPRTRIFEPCTICSGFLMHRSQQMAPTNSKNSACKFSKGGTELKGPNIERPERRKCCEITKQDPQGRDILGHNRLDTALSSPPTLTTQVVNLTLF